MERPDGFRRLIVTADDFGASPSVNAAVIEAHQKGILTAASLMVSGAAADEAVELARRNPRLGVGLHLTLVRGRALSSPSSIPGLINEAGYFSDAPVESGFRYFIERSLSGQIEREIDAQFAKFKESGLGLDHVNGHLHFHMHPSILGILLRRAGEWGIHAVRLTRDPLGLDMKLSPGRWRYRLGHSMVFWILARRARRLLALQGIHHTRHVFGLLRDGRVDANYVASLLKNLPRGDSELYSHPSLDEARHELDALTCPKARRLIETMGIRLARYQDLS